MWTRWRQRIRTHYQIQNFTQLLFILCFLSTCLSFSQLEILDTVETTGRTSILTIHCQTKSCCLVRNWRIVLYDPDVLQSINHSSIAIIVTTHDVDFTSTDCLATRHVPCWNQNFSSFDGTLHIVPNSPLLIFSCFVSDHRSHTEYFSRMLLPVWLPYIPSERPRDIFLPRPSLALLTHQLQNN